MPDQPKFNFQNPKQEKKELQYSFADYWDELRSQRTLEDETLNLPTEQASLPEKKETVRQASGFDFELKKRRPIWKDAVVFGVTVFSVWGATHVFMNFSAFAEIAQFKYEVLKTSISEGLKTDSETATASVLQKVEKRRIPFRNPKIVPRNHAKKMFSSLFVYPSDNRIVLPRIGKNVPLVTVPNHKSWNQLEENIQEGLKEGVVVHPISTAPGNFGNFFATGHSSYYPWDPGRYKDVFALLEEVKIGDMVEVYWEGKKYKYRISERKIVPPTAVDVLNQPRDRSIITLMTCVPVGTNKNRLVLVGDLVS